MSITVLINGAFGRMGQLAAKAIANHPRLELVGQTGREYDLKKAIHDSNAQVVIDFTEPSCVYENTRTILAAGARPVIGTSGLTMDEINSLKKECEALKRGAIIAPNFSLGAVLMMKYAREIAKYIVNVEIIEMHHENKIDSPSGTSLRTAQLMADVMPEVNPLHKPSKETIPGARGAILNGIPIHSIRLPGLLAHEEIIFGQPGETLTLRHDSIDRQCFMPGVCLACEKVMELNHLIYGLEDVL